MKLYQWSCTACSRVCLVCTACSCVCLRCKQPCVTSTWHLETVQDVANACSETATSFDCETNALFHMSVPLIYNVVVHLIKSTRLSAREYTLMASNSKH